MTTNVTRRRFLLGAGLAALAATGKWPPPQALAAEQAATKDVSDLLEAICKDNKLPAIVGALVRGGKIVAEGVAGVREVGKPDNATIDDRFALGSCTKRMTLLLTARLVDAGKLSFETTLGEALPDIKMRDVYRPVTIAQLLDFKGGIQPYTQVGPRITPILFQEGTAAERRQRFVEHLLQEEPVAKPGTEMNYSNAGHFLVGLVAARRTGREYPELLEEHVFRPLNMTRAGVGRPRTKDRPNEPWLHIWDDKAYVPEPDVDRPVVVMFAAAGSVFCSIRDFAKYAAYELAAAQGKNPLLTPATARRFQQIDGGGDPMADRVDFGGAPWLSAGMIVSPRRDFAAVAAVNGGDAQEACQAAFEAMRKATES